MQPRRAALVALATTLGILTTGSPAFADDYDDPVDITFPVAGDNSYIDDYDACRSGCSRRHRATDIMGTYGLPVHAARAGTVTWITGLDGDLPSYGYMITIAGDDGRSYSYVHLGRQDGPPSEAYAAGLAKGSTVDRGQHIGYLGCSGNASCTAPHLHFEIEDESIVDPYGTHMRNPHESLVAAEGRGDYPAITAPEDLSTGTPITGDFDGDGVTDAGWYLDGKVALRLAPYDVVRFKYGRAGDIPVVGDWNADGVDTLGIIRDGTWHLIDSHRSGSSDISFVYGRIGSRGEDVPLVGDWDGNGRSDPGIVRDGEWHLRTSLSAGAGEIVFTYGRVGPRGDDIPLIGDWNANGRDSIGIVRDGEWHLRNELSAGSGEIVFTYGRVTKGDRPVTGDWNRDGRTTAGIVRGAAWYLRNSNSSGTADVTIEFIG